MNKNKNVNIEAIRIISMMMVIVHHYFRHGGGTVWPEFGSKEYIIYWGIDGFVFVCTNMFVLISGYCLVSVGFKLSRIVKLWIEVVTYSVLGTVICSIFGVEISQKQILMSFIPLTTEAYWFATAYVVLLCVSPLLNAAINVMNREQHKCIIVILLIVFSIMPTFLVWERDLLTTGMDYQWFVVLYVIAAYIRKYGLPLNNYKAAFGYIICSLVTGLARVPLGIVSNKLMGSYVLSGLFFRYNSVTVTAASVFLFHLLLNIRIKNLSLKKLISRIAPFTFAVYLMHDNEWVRSILWSTLPLEKLYNAGIFYYLGGMAIVVPAIFICGCLIEYLRLAILRKLKFTAFLSRIDQWEKNMKIC